MHKVAVKWSMVQAKVKGASVKRLLIMGGMGSKKMESDLLPSSGAARKSQALTRGAARQLRSFHRRKCCRGIGLMGELVWQGEGGCWICWREGRGPWRLRSVLRGGRRRGPLAAQERCHGQAARLLLPMQAMSAASQAPARLQAGGAARAGLPPANI